MSTSVRSVVPFNREPSHPKKFSDDVDPKALWSLLNEEERAEFATVFQDPQGTKALELLEQHDVDSARFEPWWTVYASESNVVAAMPNDIVPLPNLPSGPTTTDSSKFAFNLFSIWSV